MLNGYLAAPLCQWYTIFLIHSNMMLPNYFCLSFPLGSFSFPLSSPLTQSYHHTQSSTQPDSLHYSLPLICSSCTLLTD